MQLALESRQIAGDGPFTERCSRWMERRTGSARALLTNSCTAALELAVMLVGIREGDEVIMPSFTFPSTASAVSRVGGTPVFVDIREDTLNLDESLVRQALTPKTKALMPVHYAGVGCEMDEITRIAAEYDLSVIEDAAQAIEASYRGRHLGSIGRLGCLSFHETKNLTCGEGGALLINDPSLLETAEVLRDKGTNRAQFFRGLVDHYTWVDIGSSFLASDIAAAFLWAQMENADSITRSRLEIWNRYHEQLAEVEELGLARRPVVPSECRHNGHIYHLILPSHAERERLIAHLGERGITATFHYSPLHLSPAGQRFGRAEGSLPVTERTSACIVRLPVWCDMTSADVERVVQTIHSTALVLPPHS
jgi:dTDP-4-amino-4,6-dideoxygalactose transaminase